MASLAHEIINSLKKAKNTETCNTVMPAIYNIVEASYRINRVRSELSKETPKESCLVCSTA